MAKLSPEQMAANKATSQERSKAFSARRKAYDRELAAAVAASELLPEHAARLAAHQELELALVLRKDALSAIDREIARLQAQRVAVSEQHGQAIDAAKARRDVAWDTNVNVAKVLTDAVDAAYPDMVGIYLVSLWQRPDGV